MAASSWTEKIPNISKISKKTNVTIYLFSSFER